MADTDNAIGALGEATKDQKTEDGGLTEGVLLRAVPTAIEIHPLILLSAVDHFSRMNNKVNTNRRCVGLLLGTYLRDTKSEAEQTVADARSGANLSSAKPSASASASAAAAAAASAGPAAGTAGATAAAQTQAVHKQNVLLDINNCFAVPFTEDAKDPQVWFLDTNYAEEMFRMYKKVLPKVRVVGWYSTGTEIQQNDLLIHLLLAERFCPNPVYCVINTDVSNKGLPVMAYMATEGRDGRDVEFRNIVTSLGAVEAEEIGIEHLLRDLTDSTITTLSTKVVDRHLALRKLEALLGSLAEYLVDVADGRLPVAHDILAAIQEVVDLLPLVNQMKSATGAVVAANDQALGTFVGAVARCVMALYNVSYNRRRLARELKDKQEERATQAAAEAAEKKATSEKDKEKKDEKEGKDNKESGKDSAAKPGDKKAE